MGNKNFSCAATQHVIMFFCFFFVPSKSFFVPSDKHLNSKFHSLTHKPDQTKINIKGFGMAKSAAQLPYGPVLVYVLIIKWQNQEALLCQEAGVPICPSFEWRV